MRQASDAGEQTSGSAIVVLVLAGVALGLVYNAFGQAGRRPWGLSWIAEEPAAKLAPMEELPAEADLSAPAGDGYVTSISDPLAVAAAASAPTLPPIHAVDRPVEIRLSAFKLYVDARAALVVDAREPDEYAAGHIPGAINVPYERAVSDPVLIESLLTDGRPALVYCGGGSCEVSIRLADELKFAGCERVGVYTGGFPEWVEAGYPVERGPGDQS